MISRICFKMKSHYPWTNLLMIILACFALITLGLHTYADWKVSIPFLHAHSTLPHQKIVFAVLRIFWFSSIPIFLFFMLTAIAGFWRQRFYLPLFFIFFFWLGGWHEFQEISIAWGWTTSFYLPSKLIAWSSLFMLFFATASTISWIVEYFCQKKKTGI